MVMPNIKAKNKCKRNSSQPRKTSHKMFPNSPIAPKFPMRTSFPNGASERPAILKHCRPNGIPITVIQSRHPAINQPIADINPPKIIQIRLPINDIMFPPINNCILVYYSIDLIGRRLNRVRVQLKPPLISLNGGSACNVADVVYLFANCFFQFLNSPKPINTIHK